MIENLHTVSRVFSDRLFRIPDYQRGYAWSRIQWDDLLQDLELLPDGKEHFAGTLILHKAADSQQVMDEEGKAYTLYEVIDGQQRLTTLVLLLDALRREMQAIDTMTVLASGVEKNFISVNDGNEQPLSKLTLNRDTHKFFYNNILERNLDVEGPTNRSQQLLALAKEYFAHYLAEKKAALGPDYPAWLRSFYVKISQKLTMIVYGVDAEADAWVIFETMNDRGKPITELEKVKNYLLYLSTKLNLKQANHTLARDINDTWTHIFEHLMAANLGRTEAEDQLLRAHWLMAYDYEPGNWKRSRSIKDRFNLRRYESDHKRLLHDIQHYIDTLRNAATAFCDVFNPRHPSAFNAYSDEEIRSQVKAVSEKLARLGNVTHFLPLLMAVRLKFPGDTQKYLTAVSLCEKFAFRVYRWREYRSNTGRSQLYRLGYFLFLDGDFQKVVDDLARSALYYCSNERFRRRLQLHDDENNWYRWSGLKYFLYEYEQHLARAERNEVKMLWEMVESKPNTIEHILPQTPPEGSNWLQIFSPEDRRKYTHDIGNLTLTQDNSVLSNKTFAEKKGKVGQAGCYANSIIFIEKALARLDHWTEQELLDRRKAIEEWAISRWYIEPPTAGVEIISPDLVQDAPTPEDFDRLLTRKYVSRGQRQLYKALYDAGEAGATYTELIKIMGRRDRRDFVGILGALGNRINNTPGYGKSKGPGCNMIFTWQPVTGGEWHVRLKPEMRAALERLNPGWLHTMTP